MTEGEKSAVARLVGGVRGSDSWVTGAFLLLLFSICVAAAFILFQDGKAWALLIGLATAALLWVLENRKVAHFTDATKRWNPLPGYFMAGVIISLAAFAVSLPALNSHFSWDDFAYINFYHTPSLRQFLRLFHTDLSRGVWGEDLQELRPLHGLSYMICYSLWGIHAIGYHLTGILLHVLNSLMVFLIARRLAPGDSWRAGFAGLLFAVLPAHSLVVSWVNCSLVEGPSTLFYLSAFLCFLWYRSTGLARYLVMSTMAFAACLMAKETAVTLPVMLVSYDLFRIAGGEAPISMGDSQNGRRRWRRLVLSYAPYGALLVAYLGLRRIAFSSFLRKATWPTYAQGAGLGLTGALHHVVGVGQTFKSLTGFNIRNLLLPFPTVVLGVALGLYLLWAISLFRGRRECRRSMEVVVYFGGVWYLIANAPLLATYQATHHLYIPAVGPCIASAFLAAPACGGLPRKIAHLRLLGAAVLVGFCACLLWKENAQWARQAEESANANAHLATALEVIPKQSMVIIWPIASPLVTYSWGGMYPFALQRPFTSTDLYFTARIIEPPDMYCSPNAGWREKTQLALSAQLAGPLDDELEIDVLAWNERGHSFQRKKSVLRRRLFQAYVTKSLQGPVEKVMSLTRDVEANTFLEALARLVSESSAAVRVPADAGLPSDPRFGGPTER